MVDLRHPVRPGSGNGPRVLHVSADFPDPVDPLKTPVIRSHLELTAGSFDHAVISLNRQSPAWPEFLGGLIRGRGTLPLDISSESFGTGQAVIYRAPPRGIFHAAMLRQLADWIVVHVEASQRPDLIVGHKLTVEGIAVRKAARHLGLPYAISIQGNTDTKILAARPDLRREFARVFHDAATVFPFAPWSLDIVERALGKRQGPVFLLPCPTELDTTMPPRIGGGGLLSVFHLRNHRTKNLQGMVRAMRLLERRGTAARLSIVGGGEERDLHRCRAVADNSENIVFEGPQDRAGMQARMNAAAGLVMPSRRESFGLVFIEALFAGLPIIYPAGMAVDGYFADAPFAIPVDAGDVTAIADAMNRLVVNEAELKAALAQWQGSAHAQRFTRTAISASFAAGLEQAILRRKP